MIGVYFNSKEANSVHDVITKIKKSMNLILGDNQFFGVNVLILKKQR